MNRNPVFVRNITHLTDARYFAAMGVDWMSIELNSDPTTFLRWHTLKDWVAGVKLAAEIVVPDEMLIAKTIIDAKPDGVVLHRSAYSEGLTSVQLFFDVSHFGEVDFPQDSSRIIPFGSVETDQLLAMDPQTIFIEAEWTTSRLEQLLQTGYQGGICFTGGEEDVTGVRDYELMDELLELLVTGK